MLQRDEIKEEQKSWRDASYGKKFANALRGIRVFVATTKNSHLAIYVIATAVVIILGLYFSVSRLEWIALIFAVGFVVVTEAINTAIEIDMNLTSPEYHPHARDTKDVAAGAVLLASIASVIVGLIVFLPYIL